ncbi:protein kinase [bacterium]|nr:protein kinase [bacterium]
MGKDDARKSESAPSRQPMTSPTLTGVGVGTVLAGRYEIVNVIGRGGMGCVYEARELEFDVDRTVAIKILPPNLMADERLAKRFEDEIKIAAKLDHPNIVPIYNVGYHDELLFFVMKYVNGKTLKEMVRSAGYLHEDVIRSIGAQIAGAIDYLHKQGTIHRDVKTNNIMVSDDNHAMLMDFGIAKGDASSGLTASGEILGTGPYMSPEQWDGEIDHRSDIFSFGVVLYEMATGHVPFRSDRITELMKMIISKPTPPIKLDRPDISDALSTTIMRCLEKKADDRFAAMAEVKGALDSRRWKSRPETTVSTMAPPTDTMNETMDDNADAMGSKVVRALHDAEELFSQGELTLAVERLEAVVKAHPDEPDAARTLERYRKLLSDEEAMVSQCRRLVDEQKHRQAVAALEEFLERCPSRRLRDLKKDLAAHVAQTDQLLADAKDAEAAGRPALAQKLLAQAAQREPGLASPSTSADESEAPTVVLREKSKVLLWPLMIPAAFVVVLVAWLLIAPRVAPYPYSRVVELAGDATRVVGLETRPPVLNANSLYKTAKAYRQNDGPINAKLKAMTQSLVNDADAARAKGKYKKAWNLYQRALVIEPDNRHIQRKANLAAKAYQSAKND